MNIGQQNITLIQWLNELFSSENMALTPLNSLMNTSGKVLKKDRIYKIKSKRLIKK